MFDVALDTETFLTSSDGLAAPPLVSVAIAASNNLDEVRLWHVSEAEPHLARLFDNPQARIVGHHIAFDLAVIGEAYPELQPAIWNLYDTDRVRDTMLADQLVHIARGDFRIHRYGLDKLVSRWLGEKMTGKDGGWRVNYWRLADTPCERWPEEARRYARLDALLTYRVWQHLRDRQMPTLDVQVKAAWALFRMSARGMRAIPEKVEAFERQLTVDIEEVSRELVKAGLLVWKGRKLTADKKALAALVVEALGEKAPRTPKGSIKTTDAVLDTLPESSAVAALRRYRKLTKLRSTYLGPLQRATQTPVCTRYNVLVDSTRTSSANPNVQNQPRKGPVRACWTTRPGFVFVLADYKAAELAPLAETCLRLFGRSKLAEAMIAGFDPHWNTVASILGQPYEWVIANKHLPEISVLRTLGKAANFGFPGFLSAEGFVPYARGYGVDLTLARSVHVRNKWFEAYPEMRQLRRWIRALPKGRDGRRRMVHPLCGVARGGMTQPVAGNGVFQTPVAVAAKIALYRAARACVDPTSPLFGSYLLAFIHDEIVLETPEDRAAAAGVELARLMDESMRVIIPTVPCPAEPAITRVWSKDAEPVWADDGTLLEWTP